MGFQVARLVWNRSASVSKVARTLSSEAYPLPDSIKRVGGAEQFPNEYPGHNYLFNWCLNGDGVTPTKKSAFRICKPLDLKVAGLQPVQSPIKGNHKKNISIPEAGSDSLPFETYDAVTKKVKDALSYSDRLYCPEGHAPSTRIGVRVITNSSRLAPSLLAYLDRAPKKEVPESQPITAYILESSSAVDEFVGYAIEIAEEEGGAEKSVGAVIIAGKNPSLEQVIAGIELTVEGIAADANSDNTKSG